MPAIEGLKTMTRALLVVATLRYLWSLFGNSFSAQMATDTYRQPEIFGGITNTEDWSVLTVGPTARLQTDCSNGFAYVGWTVTRRATISTTPSSPNFGTD